MKPKKKAPKQPRSNEALTAILHCKGGAMKDRREERGGSKNEQAEYLEEYNMESSKDKKVKLLVYTDDSGVVHTNENLCAHCAYFSYDPLIRDGACYEPSQSYVVNSQPTNSCSKWKQRKIAEYVTNSHVLTATPEITPAKFQFIDYSDNDECEF